nr:4'-phosphopantetheinyl transferase superfamily protein [Cognatishimia sp. F0-27]
MAEIGPDYGLVEPEDRFVARAIPARRAEFSAGRHAARRALAALERGYDAIPAGPDRAPVWPEGICGSITHSGIWAIACIGSSVRWRGIGIDLEPADPLDGDLIDEVAQPHELGGSPDRARAARCVFSAKEAVFKAQYPATGLMFGFDGISVDLSAGEARYTEAVGMNLFPPGWKNNRFSLCQAVRDDLILSLCAVPT